MPLYAVIGLDDPLRSRELRTGERDAHRAYFRANADKARFAGAVYGADGEQCGSMMVFEAESAESLSSWFRNEPFFKAGLYREFHVLDFRMALNLLPGSGWDPAFPASIPRP